MFGVICIIFHLDQNLLCKICPPLVLKRFLVDVYTERARFRSASGKRDQGQGRFFHVRVHLHNISSVSVSDLDDWHGISFGSESVSL